MYTPAKLGQIFMLYSSLMYKELNLLHSTNVNEQMMMHYCAYYIVLSHSK